MLRPHSLSAADFNDLTSPVCVSAEITGITNEILDSLDEKHRTKITPFCANGSLSILRRQESPGLGVPQIELLILDMEPDTPDWRKAPTGIPQALYALFPEPIEIGAMEDAAEDAAKFKTSTTIGKLIVDIIGPIQERYGEAIQGQLEGLRTRLEATGADRPAEMQEFDREANAALQAYFPGVTVRLHIPTPELDQLFRTGTIRTYEQDGVGRDISSLGHGAQRAVQMALVQVLADRSAAASGFARRLLIVEEPELYLHPLAVEQVRVSLKRLSATGYQILLATHSPLVISAEDIPDTLLIRKLLGSGTTASSTMREAAARAITDNPSQAHMLFSLSNSSKILFADVVLLVEGKTEQRILPQIFALASGRSLGLAGIALVGQGGASNTGKALRILNAMGAASKAIVDLDYAFRGGISDGFLLQTDPDLEACRAIMQEIATAEGVQLDPSGLPTRSGGLTAAEMFVRLGSNARAVPHIQALHSKLLESGIWLWERGAMDDHIGLDSKSEEGWAGFRERLDREGLHAMADEAGVVELVKWLAS